MAFNPPGAAMQQIGEWLEKLGMSEYAQCFASNKIDVSVLRYLSNQDLKDIGIPLGHRRKSTRVWRGAAPRKDHVPSCGVLHVTPGCLINRLRSHILQVRLIGRKHHEKPGRYLSAESG
jgi:hypothetical protein